LRKAYHLYDEGDIYADAVLMARSIR
jgi:hypothetical protein